MCRKYTIIAKYEDFGEIKIYTYFFKNALELKNFLMTNDSITKNDVVIIDDEDMILYDCFNGWHF